MILIHGNGEMTVRNVSLEQFEIACERLKDGKMISLDVLGEEVLYLVTGVVQSNADGLWRADVELLQAALPV